MGYNGYYNNGYSGGNGYNNYGNQGYFNQGYGYPQNNGYGGNQGYGYQGNGYSQNNGYQQGYPKIKKMTQRDVIDYISVNLNPSEIVVLTDFEKRATRHICMGTKEIQLLDVQTADVSNGRDYVSAQYVFCPKCRKLMINRSSLSLI